jgi:hypothetical protein
MEEHELVVFENRLYKRPQKEKLMGNWMKLHIEELNNFYTSLAIVRIIKSRSIRILGHMACMGK